jgi:hypothetical protein
MTLRVWRYPEAIHPPSILTPCFLAYETMATYAARTEKRLYIRAL